MSKITKRGSKLVGYEGSRLPIHYINVRVNALGVTNMCDLSSLHEVRLDIYFI